MLFLQRNRSDTAVQSQNPWGNQIGPQMSPPHGKVMFFPKLKALYAGGNSTKGESFSLSKKKQTSTYLGP